MKLTVAFTDEALADFDQAVDWYEEQREGLGVEFTKAVWQFLDLLCAQPGIGQKVKGDVRRAKMRKYPYSIFHAVEGTELAIHCVFHNSRDQEVWQSRLE